MSGFGGFGGFGQNNNNQQQNTGFGGGFGATTNTNTGFGATNTGFGATNNTTGGGLFGSNTSTGFGGSGGAFGSNNTTSAFGTPKPATGFGAPATTSLFGSSNTPASSAGGGFGGFGATTATSSPFGGGNTSSGLFGNQKPATTGFGAPAATSGFGGFGASNTTSAFGAPASSALGQGVQESQGTGSVPFQAYVEKEPNTSTNQQNSFQNICFQAPYQKYSPEELRLADYAQGRQHGNGSNQAGAFGASNFGGFGATNTNTNTGFGATNTNNAGGGLFGGGGTSAFGQAQPATTGFGANANTGSSLFGNKPATPSLFGPTPAATAGGIFGNSNAAATTGFGAPATGGFGSNTANTTSTLFGTNNNAPKPAFSFGNSQPASSGTGTGFGNTAATSSPFGGGAGGLFGQPAQQPTTSAFGQPQAATNSAFGGFGNNQQQNAAPSLFGNTQAKPATSSLFGNPQPAATGNGLFGNPQPAANTFGASNQPTSLFGAKPAAPSTGLFGNTNNQTNASPFSGFGNSTQNQPQQQGSSSLFSGLNNNNQQKPSLFGGTQASGGSNLFGGPQQTGFGNSQQQQQQPPQQPNSIFSSSSLFGGSQQNQQPPQSLTASIGDSNAFGASSLFGGLASNQISNPGPIATPLSSNLKAKKSAALPLYKLSSASASRFTTPQKRSGFGFSYSTYGTPNSASSTTSTPGTFGGSMLGPSTFGRGLSKSMSTSSLRRSFNTEDSILAPGAFSSSPNTRPFGSNRSVKTLTISRTLRHDLFTPPNPQPNSGTPLGGILKKRVSFDQSLNGNSASTSSPLKNINNGAPTSEELGYMRPRANGNSSKPDGRVSPPEMEQVSNANNQLAIVNEEEPAPQPQPKVTSKSNAFNDPELGDYWMKPSKTEIESMNRGQRTKVVGFTVGRVGVGQVHFDVPVDLSLINLDDITGEIVQLSPRSATVYRDNAKKPAMGKGLNVPSTISLENSWPRKRDGKTPSGETEGPRYKKHVDRLAKVPDTQFRSYDQASGVWTFSVEHFTTYGLPEEEDDDEIDPSEFGQSTLSAPPDSPTPQGRTPKSAQLDQSFETSQITQTESEPEDTFQFRKKKMLPGAFDEQDIYVDEGMCDESYTREESFLDERSVGSQSENGVEEPMEQDDITDNESVSIVDQEMAGSYPEADNTAEHNNNSHDGDGDVAMETPGAMLRARLRALKGSGTPLKKQFALGDDWTNALQKTISPKKQDRALLKSLIDIHGNDTRPEADPVPVSRRVVSDGRGFATSIDLMNSLFGQTRSPIKAKAPATSKGFEWPYAKRSKTEDPEIYLEGKERSFHDSMKPSWGYDGTLVYAAPTNAKPFKRSSRRAREKTEKNDLLSDKKMGVVSQSRDIRFAKFSDENSAKLLNKHKAMVEIDNSIEVPFASLKQKFLYSDFVDDAIGRDPAALHERLVWQLASILFDKIAVPKELKHVENIVSLLRKDKLSTFWQKLVDESTSKHVAMAKSEEEKAIASLSGHKISDACGHLVNSGNFHLSTLIALINTKSNMKRDMREQLDAWKKSQMVSEFSQPIRAMYELLAGNVCVCDGSKGVLEDRVESFIISKRFGFDWRQAFGLRLWYGIPLDETIEQAVEDYANHVAQDKETAKPHAWYVEQRVPPLWHDEEIDNREDLLWGLLKLHTFDDTDLEDVLRPENSQLSPLDIRLSWQLSQTLTASDAVKWNDDDKDRPDRTTLAFAAQLTNENSWIDAVFVLLHLTSDEARESTIKNHLAHFASKIGDKDSSSFVALTRDLKIPVSWIWEAKALFMRSVKNDPRAEVECLISAGLYDEAHHTFTTKVAPLTIIELDYETLRGLLASFSGKEPQITEWHLGGEIYRDFLELVECEKKGYDADDLVLERLLAGLPVVVEEARRPEFMETVAVETMSAVVAKAVIARGRKGEKANLPKILHLPLTEDKYLKHTVELSLEYYRGVMASAR